MSHPNTRADWHRLAAGLAYPTGHFIDGEHIAGGGTRFTVVNPASAEPLCEVASGSAAEIDTAVASGRRAFADGRWRRMAPRDRLDVLTRLASLIETHIISTKLAGCSGESSSPRAAISWAKSSRRFRAVS